ncbi:MAG TPA: TrbC/VirB2 family protein [Thermoanaerobaculia bacterium]|nr:TrbC/VirB2 family protein [Thermoanaerobaculia bacterium]
MKARARSWTIRRTVRRAVRNAARVERRRAARIAAAAVTAALAGSAAAFGGTGGTDMPWNGPMQAILDNITGPTGKIIAGLLIALGGIVWGFTRHEEGFKRVAQAIIAIGLVLGATGLVTTLGFQGCVF